MKKQFALSLVAVAVFAVVTQSTASAEGIRVKAGLATLSYQDPSFTAGYPDFKFSGQAMVLGASYVFADSGMYVDFTHRSTIGSPKWNAAETAAACCTGWVLPDQPAKLSDNTITVGKMLGDGLFAFGGYQSQVVKDEINDPVPPAYIASETITVSGFFVGAGKAIALGNGWLTPTGALAMMGNKWSASDNTGWSDSKSKDAGLGYSFGLSYSYPVTEMFDITAEGKYQLYSPKGTKTPNTVTTFGINVVAKL